MKKFLIPILVIGLITILYLFLPEKLTKKTDLISDNTNDNNEILKQELLISFRNFRESIYKLKQAEIVQSLEKKSSPKILKPELCIKMAYDLQAFIMRARLAPKAIEKEDCQKMNQYFWAIEEGRKTPKTAIPSYAKRLAKDISYFAQELNKQAWPSEDLKKKKTDFDIETRANATRLSKLPKPKKPSLPSKCMKTILMHEKEFRKVCKIQN
jgi:hypothetical protein